MKILKILSVFLLSTGVASAVIVVTDNPPEYRGADNSVHAIFDVPPSIVGLPPPPDAPVLFETGPSNYPLAPIAPGIINDGISAVITLPNFIDDLPMKKMRIQMEFYEPVFGRDIWIDVMGFDPQDVSWNVVGEIDPAFADYHYVDIVLHPNPDYETIWISTPFMADPIRRIQIDTVSIPEPASMALIGLVTGGICLVRRFFVS